MALPVAFAAGAALGATAAAVHQVLKPAKTKEEMARTQMDADTLFVVQPKTALQRAATNVVNTLFF